MSLEHILRNLNDIRVFDLFAEMGFGKDDCIDTHDVIELLECGEIERIQIEDSIEHLIKEQVLCVELINEEYTTGCTTCDYTDMMEFPRLSGHESHEPEKVGMSKIEHYYLSNSKVTKCLVSAVLESSFLESEKIEYIELIKNIELIENKIDMSNPMIGQRIHVYSNNYEDLGFGIVVDFDTLESDTGDIITNNYAYIKLDNGKILEQLNCMWYPIDEESE